MQKLQFPIKGVLYGLSNTGKSSQIANLIIQNFKATGCKARVINFDDGGLAAYQPLVAAGLVDLVDISTPPMTLTNPALWREIGPLGWFKHVVNGDWFKIDKGVLTRMPNADRDTNSNVNMLILEGLDGNARKAAAGFVLKGQKIGQDLANTFVEKGVGGVSFTEGQIAQSHYGAIQNALTSGLPALWSLNYDYVIVTTHEAVGEDKMGLDGKVYGPSMFGKALTSRIAEQIPFLGHCEIATKVDKAVAGGVAREFRLYFIPHQDLTSMDPRARWPANSRIHLDKFDALMAKYPDGYVVMGTKSGLPEFFQFWMELQAKAHAELMELLAPSNPQPSTTTKGQA